MSAEWAVRAAMLAALNGNAALGSLLNGIYDGPPVKASAPYALIGDGIGSDWGTKDADGCEVRITLSLFDKMETPARLAQIMGRADAVVRGLHGPVDGGAEGWRIVGVALIRSRTARAADQGWSSVIDYRMRVLRED
jgi:hypothetical protein